MCCLFLFVSPAKHPDAACDGGPFKIEGVSLSVVGGVQVLWSDGGVHHTGPGVWQRHLRLLLQLLESVCRLPHWREPDGALVEVVLVSALPALQGIPVLVGIFLRVAVLVPWMSLLCPVYQWLCLQWVSCLYCHAEFSCGGCQVCQPTIMDAVWHRCHTAGR
jgi:hypothetical protein